MHQCTIRAHIMCCNMQCMESMCCTWNTFTGNITLKITININIKCVDDVAREQPTNSWVIRLHFWLMATISIKWSTKNSLRSFVFFPYSGGLTPFFAIARNMNSPNYIFASFHSFHRGCEKRAPQYKWNWLWTAVEK